MNAILKFIETTLVIGILLALSVTLLLAFLDIAYVIYEKIIAPPAFIVDAEGLMELFSLILILLIGVELIDGIKAYLDDRVIHVELILLIAIIAVSRKVVVWDFDKHSHSELYSLAAMILALGVSYLLVRQGALKAPLWPRK